MSDLREFTIACDKHEKQFRATFELKPEYRGDSYWEAAFDCAARYKLYADEMNIVGDVVQRKPPAGNLNKKGKPCPPGC